MKTIKLLAGAMLFLGTSLYGRDAYRAFWNVTNVQTGRYDAAENWVEGFSSTTAWGAVPALGFWGCFDSRTAGGTDYALSFPEPTWENSHTQVRGLKAGGSVTFDSRNSFWFKAPGYRGTTNPELAADMRRDYPFLFAEGGTEGIWWAQLKTSGADLTHSGFMLTNGLLRLSNIASVTQSFDLVQGELNWRDPLGSNTVAGADLQLGYNRQDQDATTLAHTYVYTVHAGATLRGRTLTLARGMLNVPGCVDLSESLTVGVGNVANDAAAMSVTGGTVTVGNILAVGAYAKNADVAPTALTVGGDARLAVTNLRVATAANAKGLVQIGGASDVRIGGISLGATGPTEAQLVADARIGDNAVAVVDKSLQIGVASKANGRLTIDGSASVAYRNNHALEIGIGARGELTLDGNAVLTNSGPTYVCNGTGTGCQGEMTIKGNAVFRIAPLGTDGGNGRAFYLGYYGTGNMTAVSAARLTVSENAVVDCNVSALTLYGSDSLATFTGGETTFYRGNLYGGEGRNSGLVVTGGTLTFTEESRLGGEVEGRAGYNAFLRQEGGSITINKGLHVADYGSTGRVELVGGTYRGPITSAGSAQARAEFYANGGTYAMTENTSESRLSGFEDARVGAGGLTISMAGYSAPVDMAFADAEDASGEGLVTVSGSARSNILTTQATATHAKTIVSMATLSPGSACASFGKAVTVTDGGALSLAGAVTTFAAESLQLGSASGKGTLVIDAGDVVTLTGTAAFSAPNGAVAFAAAPANGTYMVLRLVQPPTDPAAVLTFAVEGIDATQRAAVSWKRDGTDTLVQVTVYAATGTSDNVWQGTSSTWNDPDNWSGGTPVPTHALVFSDAATTRQVSLPEGVTLQGITFAGSYALGGDGAIRIGSLSATAGESAVDVPLATPEGLSVTVAKGAKLSLDAHLDGAGMVTKDGSGELDVAVENPDLLADWHILLGRTVFAYLSSVGGDVSGLKLTLGPGTVQFNGTGTLTRDIVVAAGTDKAAIVDCRADVTFDGSYQATSGGFVKIGSGALSLNVTDTETVTRKASKTYLAYYNPNGGEYYPSKFATEDTVFDSCGDFGTMTNSLGGFNVLDGRLTITGSGKDLTKYQQDYWTVIGGRYPAQQADAELELRNLTWSNQSNYRRMAIGAGTCAGCPQHPTLRILDDAFVHVDGLFFGMKGNTGVCHPTLAVTNATVAYTHLHLGENSVLPDNHPTVRLGAGASVSCTYAGSSPVGKGLWIRSNVDVLVSDGGVLAAGTGGADTIVDSVASGRLRFENGGVLRTPRLRGNNGHNTSVSNLVFQFDAGVLEFVKPDYGLACSVMSQPLYHSFEVASGGLEIKTAAGVSHEFGIPVSGPGAVRKSGSGELVLLKGCRGTAESHETLTGLTTADWQGGTEIAEGLLTLHDGCLTNALMPFAIAAGAALNLHGDTFALGVVSGAGVISNGALTCTLSVPWGTASDAVPTFADVTGVVTVDFNAPQVVAELPSAGLPIARLASGTSFSSIRWRGVNKGNGVTAVFFCEDDIVKAKLERRGMILLVR